MLAADKAFTATQIVQQVHMWHDMIESMKEYLNACACQSMEQPCLLQTSMDSKINQCIVTDEDLRVQNVYISICFFTSTWLLNNLPSPTYAVAMSLYQIVVLLVLACLTTALYLGIWVSLAAFPSISPKYT